MLEIIAALTLLLLVAFAAAAAWAFRQLRAALDSHGQGLAIAFATQRELISDVHNSVTVNRDMLLESIAKLPQKGKPGRKPSGATGAKRGPKPKVTLVPPPAPAEASPPTQPASNE
jgi:hypothetical protein